MTVELREHLRHGVHRAHAQAAPLCFQRIEARPAADVGERQTGQEARQLQHDGALAIAQDAQRAARDAAVVAIGDSGVVAEGTIFLARAQHVRNVGLRHAWGVRALAHRAFACALCGRPASPPRRPGIRGGIGVVEVERARRLHFERGMQSQLMPVFHFPDDHVLRDSRQAVARVIGVVAVTYLLKMKSIVATSR